jgi:hypothetical protein
MAQPSLKAAILIPGHIPDQLPQSGIIEFDRGSLKKLFLQSPLERLKAALAGDGGFSDVGRLIGLQREHKQAPVGTLVFQLMPRLPDARPPGLRSQPCGSCAFLCGHTGGTGNATFQPATSAQFSRSAVLLWGMGL